MSTVDDHQMDLGYMTGKFKWPGETCCLKKRPTNGEAGVMGYSMDGVILAPAPAGHGMTIYLRSKNSPHDDFKETLVYDSAEAAIADGWVVD